ncbi:MAG: hypothetical protein Kow001_03740 [Acidobacteriota bacterium]
MAHRPRPEDRLAGWQAIADYLEVSVRCAQRWEARGMPVYRIGAPGHDGRKHSQVFAYSGELEAWLHKQHPAHESSFRFAWRDLRLDNADRWHVVLVSVLFGSLFAIAWPLELAYAYENYLGLMAGGAAGIWLISTAACLTALLLAGRVHRHRQLQLIQSSLLLTAAAGLLAAIGMLVLPNQVITRAGFQTLAAPVAFLKDTIYYLPLGLIFLLPTYHYITHARRTLRMSNGTPSTTDGLPVIPGTLVLRPVMLASLFVILTAGALWLMTHLLDHLLPAPGMGLFQFLLWAKMGLYCCMILEVLWWYSSALQELRAPSAEVRAG